jgi:glutamyl-tRNA reductase
VIVVVGLSHRTAPIAVRERLVLGPDVLPDFLRQLTELPEVGEALLVSTCNRVELVAAGRSSTVALEPVAAACRRALCERGREIDGHLYTHTGGAAVRHLFRVAASLDSLVVGEPQILGQVKDAYDAARKLGTVGSILHRTLPRVIRAAKRVRTETAIGNGQVSVPSVAIELTRQIFGDLSGRAVLLVGSGEMAEAVARLLKGAGTALSVIGRTPERVAELAEAVGGTPLAWAELKAAVASADVIVSSTSAPGFVIDHELVAAGRKGRRGRSRFFIDLAVPRDIEPSIERLDGEFLYNIDDLSQVVSETLSSRSREADAAEAIIAREAEGYDRWADAEQATPTIVALRARLGAALEEELSRSLRGKLKHIGPDERAALERMIEAALNRMLHQPTMRLRQAAIERGADTLPLDQLSLALSELFSLDSDVSSPGASEDALDSEPRAVAVRR